MTVRDLFQLDGRVALVAGGSRGLGLQMARALGAMGCRVAITARKADELAQAREALVSRGIEVLTLVGHLQQLDSIPALVDEAMSGLGAVDILVNNAGTTWGAPAEDCPDEAWLTLMNLNLDAPCPGLFPSKMSAGLLETIGAQPVARTPWQRLGRDEDLLGSVVFLASEAARHITDQALVVDGGALAP